MEKEKNKPSKVFNIILCAVLALEGYIVFVWEPGSSKRMPIHELYVYEILSEKARLHPWLEYADDIDYWYRDGYFREHKTFSCTFVNSGLVKLTRTPDIYVYTGDTDASDFKTTLKFCLHHEVGHYIDAVNDVSDSEEFRQAVDLSILMWKDLPEGEYHWRFVGELIANFPGINGNDFVDGYWGDYDELYAELHTIDYLAQMPPPLVPFFKDFLPEVW